MIEHVVLFKIRSSASPDETKLMLTQLLGLRKKIGGILEATAGVNFSQRARGYTHAFVVRFSDRDSLEAYMVHPEHRSVVEKYIHPISEEVLVLDYEI